MQGWGLLVLAVALEVAGTACIKASAGFTRLLPTFGTVVLYIASFVCLARVLVYIDVSVAYAVWAGLGIVLVSLLGVLVFGESITPWRAICIGFILVGVVGLNLAGR